MKSCNCVQGRLNDKENSKVIEKEGGIGGWLRMGWGRIRYFEYILLSDRIQFWGIFVQVPGGSGARSGFGW